MESGYKHPRLRRLTCTLCIMLCAVSVYTCFTHLTTYLEVMIFDLGLLIADLITLAGCVLMTIGAFKVKRVLAVFGLAVVISERVAKLCSELWILETENTAQVICTLVLVDIAEIVGLVFGAVLLLPKSKGSSEPMSEAGRLWFVPVAVLTVSFVGYLFTNIGPLTDASVSRFLMILAVAGFVIWHTDPAGSPRWIAQRIRDNEEAENNC